MEMTESGIVVARIFASRYLCVMMVISDIGAAQDAGIDFLS
ncbi:MAG: hypothetical protein Q8L10_00790 [Candidatus Moranbacteria bacterium]|nr:hypothetical protein [Candidatus Moranbacteria bacterium]